MKKQLKIGRLDKLGLNSVVIAYRAGKSVRVQNLELSPAIKLEKTDDELIIRVKLADGDFLALDEEPGIADKIEVL
jgi:hypothetical protein